MSELPKEWRTVKLAETGTWLSGGTPFTDEPLYWNGDIPWISAASLKDFNISRSDRCITQLGAHRGTQLIPSGTVLFVVRGMSLKNEFRIGITSRQVAFGQDCKAIVPGPGINGRFLAFALKARSHEILCMVDEAGHGTGRLPTDLLAKLPIGLPKFTEQQTIAEILDALDEEIFAVGKLVTKLRSTYSGLTKQLLDQVNVPARPLGEFLSTSPRNGFSPVEVDSWTGVVVLGLGCLTDDGFVPRHLKNVPAKDPRYAGSWVSDGDVLMSRANTLELVGLVGRYISVGVPCLYPDLMMKLTPNANVLPRYLEVVLRSGRVRRQLRKVAQGTSESMAKVSASSVMQLKVQIPDPVEQNRVLLIVDSMNLQIEAFEDHKAKLAALKQGLMGDLLKGRVRVMGGGTERVGTG